MASVRETLLLYLYYNTPLGLDSFSPPQKANYRHSYTESLEIAVTGV
jgi:hypothetical protein